MQTIIEFFDPLPIKNVLAAAAFSPRQMVFLCAPGDFEGPRAYRKRAIERYLRSRQPPVGFAFLPAEPYDLPGLVQALVDLTLRYPDCVFDFTGGGEVALIAAGVFCEKQGRPAFHIDLAGARLIDLQHCAGLVQTFAPPPLSVEDLLVLCGGRMLRHGHFNTAEDTPENRQDILTIWHLFLQHKSEWAPLVAYLQRAAKLYAIGGDTGLTVQAPAIIVQGGQPAASYPEQMMRLLEETGVIAGLQAGEKGVRFTYKNLLFKKGLGDYGIWLELYLYVIASQSGLFDDVQVSVVADWDGIADKVANTINEIDLVLTRGYHSLFVSCKAGMPSPLDLSEIALLAQRFGGGCGQPVLATAVPLRQASPVFVQRAWDMGVQLLDLDDLRDEEHLARRLWGLLPTRPEQPVPPAQG